MGKLKAYHLKFEVVSQCTLTRLGNILDKLFSNCHDPGKVWNWNLHQLCNLTIGDVISVVMWVFYRPQKLSPLNFNCLVESLMVTCQLLITSNAKIKRWLEGGSVNHHKYIVVSQTPLYMLNQLFSVLYVFIYKLTV